MRYSLLPQKIILKRNSEMKNVENLIHVLHQKVEIQGSENSPCYYLNAPYTTTCASVTDEPTTVSSPAATIHI